jgi:formylglycine-generating enzyme required for sulfatase activity
MRDREHGAEEDAYTSHDYVGNTQEWVATAHDRSGANDDGLGALVHVRGEPLYSIVSD